MRALILASGSKGNATVFESAARGALFASRPTRILVDAGLSRKALKQRLALAGETAWLDAIVVTHAHSDHVGECELLARSFGAKLYMSEATSRATGIVADVLFRPRERLAIGDIVMDTLPLPHDAAQVGLALSDANDRFVLMTDLGEAPASVVAFAQDSDVLLLESNHDLQMLRTGPYPDAMKRRIASARGHLSNEQCAEVLSLLHARTRRVALMHLSGTNNHAALARQVSARALGAHVALDVAMQATPLEIVARRAAVSVRARRTVLKSQAQLAFGF